MTEVPTGLRGISVLQLSYVFLKHLFELLFASNQPCQVLGTYLHRLPLMIFFRIILAEICTVAISSPSECHPVFGGHGSATRNPWGPVSISQGESI